MKRIIKEADPEVIAIDNITNTSIVGIKWESGSKIMIVSTPDGFCGLSNDVRPNVLSVWHEATVQGYLTRALNQGNNRNSTAYVFDTTSELYKWMSE